MDPRRTHTSELGQFPANSRPVCVCVRVCVCVCGSCVCVCAYLALAGETAATVVVDVGSIIHTHVLPVQL
jgi:hypothetical protein